MKKYSMKYTNTEGRSFGMCVTALTDYSDFRSLGCGLKKIAGLVECGKTPNDADTPDDLMESINKIASCMYDHDCKKVAIFTDTDLEQKKITICVTYWGDKLEMSSVDIHFVEEE